MKEIVVISGKGGTGKTSITASFAYLGGKDVVVADCDVDAADMHLLLQPDFAKSEDFYSGVLAVINQEECIQCGECADVCRFNAIPVINDEYRVVPLDCEGCGYCARVCPTDAIAMEEQNVGQWYISTTKTGNPMVHARLGIGAENSGKLVARVKKKPTELRKKPIEILSWLMVLRVWAARWYLRCPGRILWFWSRSPLFPACTI